MLFMIAEATTTAVESVMPAISSVSSLGFAIWFAWYTATHTIPKQQQEHREAIKELTTIHANTIRDLTDELKEQRESYDRWRTSHQ